MADSEIEKMLSEIVSDKMAEQPVRIGQIELGVRRDGDPDTSKPNPSSIEWYQDFKVAIKETTGSKPKTIVTCPEALWYLDITFNSLDNRDEVLDRIIKMNAGPYTVRDATNDLCMILQKKKIKQIKGTPDWYRTITLTFVQNNPGVA